MKKTLLLFTGILFSHFMNAQKIYVYSGKNLTEYDYKTTPGQSQPNLKSDNGYYFELGYEHDLSKRWMYMGGITLNQFNNVGGDEFNYYSWNTNYLGLQNTIGFSFIHSKYFKTLLTGGVGVSTLLSGEQQINNSLFDLKEQNNFKGVFVHPAVGLEMRFNIADLAELSLKYDYSKAWNVSKSDPEKLSFNTNQIALGIHIPLKGSAKRIEDPVGPQGPQGLQGLQGPAGPQGPAGKPAPETDQKTQVKDLINSGYIAAYFDFDKTEPTKVSSDGIAFLLTYLRNNPTSKVTITGNADETGDAKYNEKLALERANSVKRILKEAGIQENRITVQSKGEDTSVDPKSKNAKRLVRKVNFQVD